MSQSISGPKLDLHVVTLFPEMIDQALKVGVVGQAVKNGLLSLNCVNPRSFTSDVHHTVDDRPFGGGDGMVMLAEVLAQSIDSIRANSSRAAKAKVIHFSPRGVTLTGQKARALAKEESLILVSSRYGGADQRFLNSYVDEEVSIGDYVLSGGEIAALALIDATARHVPGVLGNSASSHDESFSLLGGLLEQPQFTRPAEWRGASVPSALTSGNHAQVGAWKRALALLTTLERRPDLLSDQELPANLIKETRAYLKQVSSDELRSCGLTHSVDVLSQAFENWAAGEKK